MNQLHSDWKLCVAPMMEWTDRHCRFFHRLLTRQARLTVRSMTHRPHEPSPTMDISIITPPRLGGRWLISAFEPVETQFPRL